MVLKNYFLIILPIFFIIISSFDSNSVEPGEIIKDKGLESRARKISKNIRCMVCQNQSIDESNAELAKDLRILIRKKILENHNDKEIYKFLTDRFGDFILLKPAFKLNTLLLWLLPFLFLIFGFAFLIYQNKKSKNNF